VLLYAVILLVVAAASYAVSYVLRA